jgi:hypothetical protein
MVEDQDIINQRGWGDGVVWSIGRNGQGRMDVSAEWITYACDKERDT